MGKYDVICFSRCGNAAKTILYSVLVTVAFYPIFHFPACADDSPKRGETVSNRARPAWDAQGIHVSGFTAFPEVTTAFVYDDNIYSDQDSPWSDKIAEITPKLSVKSNWNNNKLDLSASSSAYRYKRTSNENHEDHSLRLDGRLDFTRDIKLHANLRGEWLNEERSSPDDADGISPTKYNRNSIQLRYQHKLNRFEIDAYGKVTSYDYQDTQTTTTIVNNDDRDRVETKLQGEASYEANTEYRAFVRLSVNNKKYENSPDDTGVRRNSNGYEAVTGVKLDYTGITFGEVFAGYLEQEYEDRSLKKARGPSYGTKLTWTPSGLTTVVGKIERDISETTVTGASGIVGTKLNLRIDHELLRNLIFKFEYEAKNSNFSGIDRIDKDYHIGAGARYLLSQSIHIELNYDYKERVTNNLGSNFKNNHFAIRLKFQI